MSTIKLEETDLKAGLALSKATACAQARWQAFVESEQAFAQNLFAKYNIDPQQYMLANWFDGFVPVDEAMIQHNAPNGLPAGLPHHVHSHSHVNGIEGSEHDGENR